MDEITSSDKFKLLKSKLKKDAFPKKCGTRTKALLPDTPNVALFKKPRDVRGTSGSLLRGGSKTLSSTNTTFRNNVTASFLKPRDPVAVRTGAFLTLVNSGETASDVTGSKRKRMNLIKPSGAVPKAKLNNLIDAEDNEVSCRNNPPNGLYLKPSFSINVEKDSTGFLKPLHPAPRVASHTSDYSYLMEREIAALNVSLARLRDRNLFDEVEMVYHCSKGIEFMNKAIRKVLIKTGHGDLLMRMDFDELLDRMANGEFQFSDLSIPSYSSFRPGGASSVDLSYHKPYLLKNWTVILGSDENSLMLSGALVDHTTGMMMEDTHLTSNIVEHTGNNLVRTTTSSYQLCGRFVGTNNIPLEIQKHFKNGKFPGNWKLVISEWQSLLLMNSVISTCEKTRKSKRAREGFSFNTVSKKKR